MKFIPFLLLFMSINTTINAMDSKKNARKVFVYMDNQMEAPVYIKDFAIGSLYTEYAFLPDTQAINSKTATLIELTEVKIPDKESRDFGIYDPDVSKEGHFGIIPRSATGYYKNKNGKSVYVPCKMFEIQKKVILEVVINYLSREYIFKRTIDFYKAKKLLVGNFYLQIKKPSNTKSQQCFYLDQFAALDQINVAVRASEFVEQRRNVYNR